MEKFKITESDKGVYKTDIIYTIQSSREQNSIKSRATHMIHIAISNETNNLVSEQYDTKYRTNMIQLKEIPEDEDSPFEFRIPNSQSPLQDKANIEEVE